MPDPTGYRVDGTVLTYADELSRAVTVGEQLVAGDGEGSYCPATVTEIAGTRIVLRLDLDQFRSDEADATGKATGA